MQFVSVFGGMGVEGYGRKARPKLNTRDKRNLLFHYYIKIIIRYKPKYFKLVLAEVNDKF